MDAQRALVLLEFGCPPLPVANGQRMETNEPVIVNSHDLLSVFFIQAFKQQNTQFNNTRKKKQQEALEGYYKTLLASDGSAEAIYDAMSDYTRRYLASYFMPGHLSERDIHILPMDMVPPAMLNEIRDYYAAMHVMEFDKPADAKNDSLRKVLKDCHRLLCIKAQAASS